MTKDAIDYIKNIRDRILCIASRGYDDPASMRDGLCVIYYLANKINISDEDSQE